ncbi:MAG: 50S ribosomal protein L4 [Deltaproteobacteria bacterium]|nr:MAG: 50S ribosomal protein L4 [Deltaproteobacteria bacterium]
MALIDVHNVKGEKIHERDIKDEIFNVFIREDILHQVIRGQLTSSRSGSASTKNRSKVRASSRKLWRQKGTGRARVGAASSPLRRGGGVAFGPLPRDYSLKINKKIRKMALRMALADKYKAGQILVVDNIHLEEKNTGKFFNILKTFDLDNVLIITEREDENLEKSSRNIRSVKLLRAEGLNVYDILSHENLLFIEGAMGKVEEALAG